MAAETGCAAAVTKTANNGGWVEEVDYLRGFAVLAVLMIHSCSYFFVVPGLNAVSGINLSVGIYSMFAVPLFVLISGFAIHRQYSEEIDVLRFYRKRLTIIPPYLIFSLAYVVLVRLVPDPVSGGIVSAPITPGHIASVIFNAQGYMHLWFFSIIIQFYLLYPLFRRIYSFLERKGAEEFLLVASFAAQAVWNTMTIPTGQKIPGTQMHLFLEELFYFVLGMFAARNFDGVKRLCGRAPMISTVFASIVIMAGAVVPVATGLLYNGRMWDVPALYRAPAYVLAPAAFVFTFIFLYKLAIRLSSKRSAIQRFVKSVGALSFGIYLAHMIFNILAADGLSLAGIGPNDLLFYPIVFIMDLAATYVATYGLSLLPFSEWIIGSSSFRKMRKRTGS